MATNGSLQPTDLVWKEGLENWIPAGQVQDLFSRRSTPPPIPASTPLLLEPYVDGPSVNAPAGYPIGGRYAAAAPHVSPPLWNPGAAGIWSLFVSLAFGSLLVAINWRELGEAGQSKRAMNWFYAALVLLAVNLFTPESPGSLLIISAVNLILLLAWNFLECERQRRLLKQLFGNRYERRGLFVPVVLAIGCLFIYSFVAGAIAEVTRR